jgi:hypothetical protein
MKIIVIFICISFSTAIFSQKKVMKSLQTNASEINIYTKGLDNIILENSSNDFLEVILEAKSYDEQLIKIDADAKKVAIGFDFEGTETREVIFRKFITKRLQRATAIVKIPKGKKVYIFGENVDIETKSLLNDLAIYIENGIVRLHAIQANLLLKLYSGNVYATLKETNINVISKSGKILVDDVLKEKEFLKSLKSLEKQTTIISLKANIFLTTQ